MSKAERIDDSLPQSDSESDRDFLSGSSDDEDSMDGDVMQDPDDDEMDHEEEGATNSARNGSSRNHVDEDDDEGMGGEAASSGGSSSSRGNPTLKRRTYIPGVPIIGEDGTLVDPSELDFDESAYLMYHKAECGYPCLSFDVIPDSLGSSDDRATTYPQTVYLVAGTQAPKVHANKLLVMKMSNLTKMKHKKSEDESDSEEDDDEDEEDDDPDLLCAQIPHDGAVNRVRTITLGSTQVASSWSETGHVSVWDLTKQLQAVEDKKTNDLFNKLRNLPKPIFSFRGHRAEGYGMDWSLVNKGYLATGDQNKKIFIWKPLEAFSWNVDQQPLTGHEDSVEDIQWSPNEGNILVSCSVDKSIRVWDIRTNPSGNSANVLTVSDAHDSDVNVVSWNKLETAILLSGGDDGFVKTWDMRQFGGKNGSKSSPIAVFKHHSAAVTSIEWHPKDNSVFAASGEDNQITLWDLAVEKDDEEEECLPSDKEDEEEKAQLDKLPPQLLFIHQGVNEVKELHWHPQIPGLVIATSSTGFDVFRTISV